MTNINDNGDMILDLKTKILILRARDFAGKNRTRVGLAMLLDYYNNDDWAEFIKFYGCENWGELKESMLDTAKFIASERKYGGNNYE